MNTTVEAWEETITFPTYTPPPADLNPMFLEKRVNQGTSGRVYPQPFSDKLASESEPQDYQAVYLENEYIRLMLLPQIGGRIHEAVDKTTGYPFIYRQHVIKPALIGLFGAWISGGIEFNWPQHHRPSTFMPTQHLIEESADGSVTVWLSENDPLQRMKGMVGVCLHPGKAFFELKVQLYNRTPEDLPLVGQRRRPRPRAVPGLLPAGRDRRDRPLQAFDVVLPRCQRHVLRRGLRE